MVIALLGLAAPGFLLALMLIYFMSYQLGLFPVRGAGEAGDLPSQLRALALPALALGFNSAALTARNRSLACTKCDAALDLSAPLSIFAMPPRRQ